jgi:predicted nucleic acid-binding protein
MNRTAVVDTSVAFSWYVPQKQTAAALHFLAEDYDLRAPVYIALEMASALLKGVRAGAISEDDYHWVMESELPGDVSYWEEFLPLLPAAFRLALRYGGRIYDIAYIVLAQQLNVPLITADYQQADIARKVGVDVKFVV